MPVTYSTVTLKPDGAAKYALVLRPNQFVTIVYYNNEHLFHGQERVHLDVKSAKLQPVNMESHTLHVYCEFSYCASQEVLRNGV